MLPAPSSDRRIQQADGLSAPGTFGEHPVACLRAPLFKAVVRFSQNLAQGLPIIRPRHAPADALFRHLCPRCRVGHQHRHAQAIASAITIPKVLGMRRQKEDRSHPERRRLVAGINSANALPDRMPSRVDA